jgi:hypothetical protein
LRFAGCAAFNGIIEGREWVAVGALAVVLGANCLELPSDTDENSTQFGHQCE